MMRSALHCAVALGAIALAAACQPQTAPADSAQPPGAAPQTAEADEGGAPTSLVPTLSCDANAMFSAATTRQSLVDTHGAENVTDAKVPWVDSEIDAVVLWANDPTMRAEVLWLGPTSGKPDAARVGGGPDSLWVGPAGLLLGSTVADIEAANGGPFMMTAFENHNHGEVSDFLGGKLAAAETAGCRISFSLDAGEGAPEAALAALSGDSEKSFRSDSPEVRAANPVIVEMTTLFMQ
jgi:hypothetical protein